jgi:hypothetical protein
MHNKHNSVQNARSSISRIITEKQKEGGEEDHQRHPQNYKYSDISNNDNIKRTAATASTVC